MCFRDAEGHTPGESARAIAESQLPGAPANSQSRPKPAGRILVLVTPKLLFDPLAKAVCRPSQLRALSCVQGAKQAPTVQ